jgi:RHS repeat-associated protein
MWNDKAIMTDWRGVPRVVYDEGGKEVWRGKFGSFGEPLYERGVVSNYIPFRLYGMYNDMETGSYYNVRRYYDWRVGRYLQPDPVSDLNLYAYVNNSPYDLVDPLGMFETKMGGDLSIGDARHEEITEDAARAILPSYRYNVYGGRWDNWDSGPTLTRIIVFGATLVIKCRSFADTIAQGANRADCLFADNSGFHCDNDNFEGCYWKGKMLESPESYELVVCSRQQSAACCGSGSGGSGTGGGSSGGGGGWTDAGGWNCRWTNYGGRLVYECAKSGGSGGGGGGGGRGCSVVNGRLREKSSCPPYPWMCDPNNPGYVKDSTTRRYYCECYTVTSCSFARGWSWERIGHFIHPVQDFWSHSNALFVSGCAVYSESVFGARECVEPVVDRPRWTQVYLPNYSRASEIGLFTGLYGGSKAGYSWEAWEDMRCTIPGSPSLSRYPPCDLGKGVMAHCMLNKDSDGWDNDCYAPCYQGHWQGDCGGKDNMQRYIFSEARERALSSSKYYLGMFCRNSPGLCY